MKQVPTTQFMPFAVLNCRFRHGKNIYCVFLQVEAFRPFPSFVLFVDIVGLVIVPICYI